jgi:hypothetical protein
VPSGHVTPCRRGLAWLYSFVVLILGNRPGETEYWTKRNHWSLIYNNEMNWNNKPFGEIFENIIEVNDVRCRIYIYRYRYI